MKETDCCPLMLRTSPVTLTSPLDMPGCSIDTLESVYKIWLLDIPSISTETVGVPCSNKTKTADLSRCLHLHLFLISLIHCFLFHSPFYSVWELTTFGKWTSQTFAWVLPSRRVNGVHLAVKPSRVVSNKVPYPFTLVTPEGSFGLGILLPRFVGLLVLRGVL